MFTTSSIIDNLNQSEGLEYKKLCRLLKITKKSDKDKLDIALTCLLYTSPSPRDYGTSRMPSSA